MDSPVSESEFAALMARWCPEAAAVPQIACAVSGGGDSLALLFLLSRWSAKASGPAVYAMTVDHGLRPESTHEARDVAAWVQDWPRVSHQVLTWRGRKPKTAIQERARTARYELLRTACQAQGVTHLFLAHQQDDQAETLLMRLAAGSGLDGLAGIASRQNWEGMVLCRPLLTIPHARLLATLRGQGISWLEDPSNLNDAYLRPRLRAARTVLEAEGLTSARLSVTAGRLARGREALEVWAEKAWSEMARVSGCQVVFEREGWEAVPEEIQLRLCMRALGVVNGKQPAARLEQMEGLLTRLANGEPVTRATLSHVLLTRGTKWIKFFPEKSG